MTKYYDIYFTDVSAKQKCHNDFAIAKNRNAEMTSQEQIQFAQYTFQIMQN